MCLTTRVGFGIMSQKEAHDIRAQGFSGAAMLPYADLEYSGIDETMEKLEKRFHIRE